MFVFKVGTSFIAHLGVTIKSFVILILCLRKYISHSLIVKTKKWLQPHSHPKGSSHFYTPPDAAFLINCAHVT